MTAALDTAGITGTRLRAAYERARQLHRRHGRTYYLATRLLPPGKRPFVHALYGFARYADELVDGDRTSPGEAAHALDVLGQRALGADVATGPDDVATGPDDVTTGPEDAAAVVAALRDTLTRFELDPALIADFLTAMRADLVVTDYPTYDALRGYMHGSAAAIGQLMVPILGTTGAMGEATAYARSLGIAFQLTNFIRDVGEDLERGRIYLPATDLAYFDVDRDALAAGVVTPAVRALLTFEIGRTRGVYRSARPGIGLLDRASRPCVEASFRLYSRILDEIEHRDYDVFSQRVSVSRPRRLGVAVPAAAQAVRYRTA